MENIEGEYIKNLQQQIYFLELESNYLYPFLVSIFSVDLHTVCDFIEILIKIYYIVVNIKFLNMCHTGASEESHRDASKNDS